MIESEATGLEKVELIIIQDGVGVADVEMIPAEREFTFVVGGTARDGGELLDTTDSNAMQARFCCTPHRVRALAAGWLVGEGIIEDPREFVALEIDLLACRVRIEVSQSCLDRLSTRISAQSLPVLGDTNITRSVNSSLDLQPERIEQLVGEFRKLFLSLKSSERMCYLACIASDSEILTFGEGFHRLNALYRAMGELVVHGKELEGRIALLNFGLSRSLVARLARAGVAMAICLAPPTSSAVELANDRYLSIVVSGMGEGTRIYSAPWRVI